MICGKTPEELLKDIRSFHNFVAPGLLIGAFMVDLAYRRLGENVEADAIVETRHCLPDAVQLFSPCTVGNGWLKILDWDKFAISFHDRHSHEGVRVWLDLDKTTAHPDIGNWFMGRVSKRDLPKDVLISAIFKAGADILSSADIKVVRYASREKKGVIKVCNVCHEACAASPGELCFACQGEGYYQQVTA